MSFVLVDLYVLASDDHTTPLEGVTVGILDSSGTTLLTTATTDSSGLASLLLDAGSAGVDYSVRLYRAQTRFDNPKRITVIPVGSNSFNIFGEVFVPPTTIDARFCVAYGVFRTSTGRPAAYSDIQFVPRFKPLLLETSPILVERDTIRTDENGYAEVPLIRLGQYDVILSGLEDAPRCINVPDRANIAMADLLFPVVKGATFSPDPVSIAVGERLVITPSVTTTDFRTLVGTAMDDVMWDIDNAQVASLGVSSDTLVVFGLTPGTCHITMARRDNSIIQIPARVLTGVPFPVTVTP